MNIGDASTALFHPEKLLTSESHGIATDLATWNACFISRDRPAPPVDSYGEFITYSSGSCLLPPEPYHFNIAAEPVNWMFEPSRSGTERGHRLLRSFDITDASLPIHWHEMSLPEDQRVYGPNKQFSWTVVSLQPNSSGYQQVLNQVPADEKPHMVSTEPSPATMRDTEEAVQRAFNCIVCAEPDENDEEESARIIEALILVHGRYAVLEIERLIRKGSIRSETIDRVLRAIGHMSDTKTHRCRRWLLERVLLSSSSPEMRDSANIGISLMDDPKSIPAMKKAVEREVSPLLSKLLKKTLRQLENV